MQFQPFTLANSVILNPLDLCGIFFHIIKSLNFIIKTKKWFEILKSLKKQTVLINEKIMILKDILKHYIMILILMKMIIRIWSTNQQKINFLDLVKALIELVNSNNLPKGQLNKSFIKNLVRNNLKILIMKLTVIFSIKIHKLIKKVILIKLILMLQNTKKVNNLKKINKNLSIL